LPDVVAAGEVRARSPTFFAFKGGRIWGVRNYDCFQPW